MEIISIREYARRLGINEKAVRKARDLGKIAAGIDQETGKIIFEKANEEWGNLHFKADIEKVISLTKAEKKALKVGTIDVSDTAEMNPDTNDTFADLQRKDLFVKTQIGILKRREMERELVSRSEVNKQLFEIGKEIRLKFESLADRCIDDILAASDDRNKAHGILLSNIKDLLTEVASKFENGV